MTPGANPGAGVTPGAGPGFVDGPAGPIEVVALGRGEPVTVYAHGVGVGIAGIRAFASKVPGTRVFFHHRGHGRTATPPLPWDPQDLADELLAVADAVGATAALGVSLGAGSLLRAMARHPHRFERAVLVLPSVSDLPRDPAVVASLVALGERMCGGDRDAVVDLLVGDAGLGAGADVHEWAVRAAADIDPGPLGLALRAVPDLARMDDVAPLAAVTTRTLVVGQEGDATHPAAVARRLGQVLPDARVEVFGPGGLLFAHRAAVRELLSGFLTP